MKNEIKISIITVCRNSGGSISKCISSVQDQNYDNIEYVVIDGASTDNTMDEINKYNDRIDKVISEPDSGIFDAMNKGINNSSGDYLIFLNADDYFISDSVIENIVRFIEESSNGTDIFYGKVLIYNKEGGRGFIWKAAKVSKYSLFRGSIPHPATIYSRKAFDKCGQFDISYKIAGDYEWIVRAYLNFDLVFQAFDSIVSVFLKGGISTDSQYKILSKEEITRIRSSYFNSLERKYYNLRWFFRKNFKFW